MGGLTYGQSERPKYGSAKYCTECEKNVSLAVKKCLSCGRMVRMFAHSPRSKQIREQNIKRI